MKYKLKENSANVKKSLRYILRSIVMLFLRAKVIPVNPQIHGHVMCSLFVLSFIFEPLFVHAPDKNTSKSLNIMRPFH
jgi:hypothetical protein